MSSNVAVLTQSHKAIAAKKRSKREQIKEVVFDEDARRDFLTGFHKRKLAKKEESKRKAIEREKQERLDARREQRRMLAERAVQNAAEVEQAYGAVLDPSEEEWTGFSAPTSEKGKQKAEEFEDEEQLATVTVVEDFDPDALIHGPPRIQTSMDDQGQDVESTRLQGNPQKGADSEKKKIKAKANDKVKKKRYLTKAARKVEQKKQRARRTEKAELAGGKASRKNNNRRKR